MVHPRRTPALGLLVYFTLTAVLGLYFAFASVQGNFGLLRRVEIQSESQSLESQSHALSAEIAALRNKTHRLSDTFLDLDLLDEQVRSVLGYVRRDEIVLR